MATERSSARPIVPKLDELDGDVPAAVLCAFCGRGDCTGCGGADEQASGIVAIVPWERPGAGTWSRLFATAKLTTVGAESFFSALPDGEASPALRFAVVAESNRAGDLEAEKLLRKQIAAKVVDAVGLRPADVVILPPGALPKTPSGKLRRAAAAVQVAESLAAD